MRKSEQALITEAEFLHKLSAERAGYQAMSLNVTLSARGGAWKKVVNRI